MEREMYRQDASRHVMYRKLRLLINADDTDAAKGTLKRDFSLLAH
jgi:hypothetical protein